MAPPTFIIHRVVLWIAQHIAESFSLDADFFLVAWDGVRSIVVVKKTEKMQRCKKLQMLQIYLCYFFQLVLIFGPFWVIFGLFGGNFRSFLGHFLVLIFCGKILLCAI